MADKSSVTESESDTDIFGNILTQASNPDVNAEANEKDASGVPWENRAKEAQRKYESAVKTHTEAVSRLEELEEIVRKTESEKEEQKKLQRVANGLEQELQTFETQDQFRAAREYIKKSSESSEEKASEKALSRFYAEQVNDFVQEEAAKRNLKSDNLREELLKLVTVSMMEMNPLKRTKEALKEFDRFLSYKKKEKELADKELALNEFTETGQRIPRETTVEEAKKSGNLLAEAKALGL